MIDQRASGSIAVFDLEYDLEGLSCCFAAGYDAQKEATLNLYLEQRTRHDFDGRRDNYRRIDRAMQRDL